MEYEKALVELESLKLFSKEKDVDPAANPKILRDLLDREWTQLLARWGVVLTLLSVALNILFYFWWAYYVLPEVMVKNELPIALVFLAFLGLVGLGAIGFCFGIWDGSREVYRALVRPWTKPLIKAINRYNSVVVMLQNAIRIHQIKGHNSVFTEWVQSQIELLSPEKERLFAICSTYEQLKNVPASLDKEMARTFLLSPAIAPEACRIVEQTKGEIGDFTDSLEKIETSIRDFHPPLGSWK